jgi:hypothetical protein
MNFGINWDAVFPYPYHGVWMPYRPFYSEPWENCFIHPTYDEQPTPFEVNYSWINSYQASLMDAGTQVGAAFSTCTYGNFFEFGWNVSDGGWPRESCAATGSEPLSCHEQSRPGLQNAARWEGPAFHT